MDNRRPTTQDISWFLDLHRNKQLDIDPPYQRRSVWTHKDRQFFLDTIFRNYPSPAIFLHKTIDDNGRTTYHVVDGKQRLETILRFVNNELRIGVEFGDLRLNGKKWKDLQSENELKKRFWDYQITVEMIDFSDTSQVNAVFDRLNRNSRKLTAQELRHAKYDGWLITKVEEEATREEWRDFGVVTTGRTKRMLDVQFISELAIVILEREIVGFDQNHLDDLYAQYEDPLETIDGFNEDDFNDSFSRVRDFIKAMEEHNHVISYKAKAQAHFYTLWCFIFFNGEGLDPKQLAEGYSEFLNKVESLTDQGNLSQLSQEDSSALTYLNYSRGATTDLTPRKYRYEALVEALSN